MKVVIVGQGDMLLNLIRGAMLAGVEISGVFRSESLNSCRVILGLRDFFKPSNVRTLMKKNKIRDLRFKSVNSEAFRRFMIKENVDILLVGSWKEKFRKETIDLPVIGTINVHPSLLPKYRGPNPYLQTILHGEKKSGVTFHLMNENFDCGPVLAQAEVEILEGDTGKELKNKTVFKARLLCAELLEKLCGGLVIPVPQDENSASYYSNVKQEDMTLDFENETAEELLRRVRAFHPWLPTYFQYGNVFFKLNPYKTEISADTGAAGEILAKGECSLTVAAKDGRALKMDGLKLYKFPCLTKWFIKRINF